MTMALAGLVIFIGAMLWAVRVGRKNAEHTILKGAIKKLGRINKFNRKEDEEVERLVKSAGDNPNSVMAPWLRKRE